MGGNCTLYNTGQLRVAKERRKVENNAARTQWKEKQKQTGPPAPARLANPNNAPGSRASGAKKAADAGAAAGSGGAAAAASSDKSNRARTRDLQKAKKKRLSAAMAGDSAAGVDAGACAAGKPKADGGGDAAEPGSVSATKMQSGTTATKMSEKKDKKKDKKKGKAKQGSTNESKPEGESIEELKAKLAIAELRAKIAELEAAAAASATTAKCGVNSKCEEEDNEAATHYCEDCELNACNRCNVWHGKKTSWHGHTVVAL
jgi:hypothetical protein